MKFIKFFSIIFICFSISNGSLLDGYYQVVNLVIIQNDKPRGFNNNHLYIFAEKNRIAFAGAWRGIPIKESLTVEKIISDTLVLRDNSNQSSYYKFRVKGDSISGRHAVSRESRERLVIETKAVVRKLNPQEAERIKKTVFF
ncbi:MAG: hypothetical protein LBI42_02645 [Chitinispirillales bacterium]|nr:hypothetical protein [Chitinispirillales bacterium]